MLSFLLSCVIFLQTVFGRRPVNFCPGEDTIKMRSASVGQRLRRLIAGPVACANACREDNRCRHFRYRYKWWSRRYYRSGRRTDDDNLQKQEEEEEFEQLRRLGGARGCIRGQGFGCRRRRPICELYPNGPRLLRLNFHPLFGAICRMRMIIPPPGRICVNILQATNLPGRFEGTRPSRVQSFYVKVTTSRGESRTTNTIHGTFSPTFNENLCFWRRFTAFKMEVYSIMSPFEPPQTKMIGMCNADYGDFSGNMDVTHKCRLQPSSTSMISYRISRSSGVVPWNSNQSSPQNMFAKDQETINDQNEAEIEDFKQVKNIQNENYYSTIAGVGFMGIGLSLIVKSYFSKTNNENDYQNIQNADSV